MQKEMLVRYSTRMPNSYEIYFEGGGEVPAVLTGHYTDSRAAQRDIELYLNNRKKKVSRGKSTSE